MKLFSKMILIMLLALTNTALADKSNLKEQDDCTDKVYAEKNPDKCPCEGGCSSGNCGAGSNSNGSSGYNGSNSSGSGYNGNLGGAYEADGGYVSGTTGPGGYLSRRDRIRRALLAARLSGRRFQRTRRVSFPRFGMSRMQTILYNARRNRGWRLNSLKYQISCGKGGVANEPELTYGALMIHEEKPSELLFSPQALVYTQTLASKLIDKDIDSLPSGIDRRLDFVLPSGRVLNFELATGSELSTLSGELQTEGMILERLDANWNSVTENEVYYVRYYPGLASKVYYDATTLLPVKYVSAEGRTITMNDFPIEVIYDDLDDDGLGETIRQVHTGNHLFDVVVPDDGITPEGTSCKYEIRCYDAIGVADKDTYGRYTIDKDSNGEPHKPFITYIISNISSDPNNEFDNIQISQVNNPGTTFEVTKNSTYTYTLSANEWTVSIGDGMYNEALAKEENGDKTILKEIRTVTDSNDQIVSKSEEIEYKINGEYTSVASVQDPSGEAETSVSVYYTNSADCERFNTADRKINGVETCFETNDETLYGKSRGYVEADGSWSLTFYDSEGRESAEVTPYLNTTWDEVKGAGTINDLPVGCVVTLYDYAPLSGDTNKTEHTDKVRTVTTKTNGIVTSINYTVYSEENGGLKTVEEEAANQNAAYGNSANNRSTTVYYPSDSGFEAGRVKYSSDSTGMKTTYSYKRGQYNENATPSLCSFTIDPNGSSAMIETITEPLVAFKSTKSISVSDSQGNSVLSETWLYTGEGYERIDWSVNRFDSRGHITQTDLSNGTYSTAEWGCCNKQSEILADGTEYTYQYDAMDRLISSVKKGTATTADITTSYTYDAMGRVLTATVTAGDEPLVTSQNEYNFAGELVKETALNGNITTYANDTAGRTSTTTSPTGLTVITENNIDGSSKCTTGTGTIAEYYSYGVNSDGSIWEKLNSVTQNGERWSKTLTNMQGHTVSESPTNESGVSISTKDYYDERGNVIRSEVVDSNGNKLSTDTIYEYNSINEVTRSGQDIDGDGVLTLASMDVISESTSQYEKINGNWFSVTESYSYPKDNNAEKILLGEGRSQRTGFANGTVSYSVSIDAKGNQTTSTTVVDRNTKTITSTVNSPAVDTDTVSTKINGVLVSTRDEFGKTTTYEYDELGRLIATNIPELGRTGITAYNDKGQTISVTDATGVITSFEYDQFGRQIATIDPRLGGDNITVYDSKGRVESTTDAAGNIDQFVYSDIDNKVIETTNPLDKKVYSEYTVQGQLTKTWGDATYPVFYEYDIVGRMVKMTTYSDNTDFTGATWPENAPAGDTTTWNYDDVTGKLLSKTDANGNATTYTYDRMGRVKTRTWARPDANDNALVTSYEYDPITGQQTKIYYSDSTQDITFTYDNFGRQASVTDVAGTRTFSYDTKSQLTSETLNEFIKNFSYDSSGRDRGFTLNQGELSLVNNTISYDTFGRLATASQNGASVAYSYLANSPLLDKQSLHGGAIEQRINYEAKRNLPTSIGYFKSDDSLLAKRNYTFDAIGRVSARVQTRGTETPRNDSFGYNNRDELTSATLGTDNYGYNFDNLGSRVSTDINGETTNYTVNEVNQYTSISADSAPLREPVFDADGNQTLIHTETGTWNVTYNAENRPVEFLQGTTKIECVYDYMGRRISKKVFEKDETNNYSLTANSYYVYDGFLQIASFDVANDTKTLNTTTFWDPMYGESTRPIAMEQDGSTYYYGVDYTKNVCELFSVGTSAVTIPGIAVTYDYSPFGTVTEQTPNSQLLIPNSLKFSSEYHDDELELIYYNYRHYNPKYGHWLTKDPIEEKGGLNLYGIVANNPVDYWDILGFASYEFDCCSESQQTKIKSAMTNTKALINVSLGWIYPPKTDKENKVTFRFQRWFGKNNSARVKMVKSTYKKIKSVVQKKKIHFNCARIGTSGTIAEVDIVDGKYGITVFPDFWSYSDDKSFRSKAGVFIHELAHEVDDRIDDKSVDDHGPYGKENASFYAKYYPWTAITNADNYRAFSTDN